jgi:hypothetical protein
MHALFNRAIPHGRPSDFGGIAMSLDDQNVTARKSSAIEFILGDANRLDVGELKPIAMDIGHSEIWNF